MTTNRKTRVTVVGSTGSVGRSTLEVIRAHPERFDVVALAAHSNVNLLRAQIKEFRPHYVALGDEAAGRELKRHVADTQVLGGAEALLDIAAVDTDVTLSAIVGAAGLHPLLRAIEQGHHVAVANKEPLVMAGRVITQAARKHGATLLPVDSEHNAIFQCLQGHEPADVYRVHLTASGGPFYGKPRSELQQVTPEEATRHPTWDMGAKISVDSATLMNKGLEIIEAMWLFDLPFEKIRVIIHPQSTVHGLVEFNDGSFLAHLGVTDMKIPIAHALAWPQRFDTTVHRLDLAALGSLTFAEPDFSDFPCLRLAMNAAKVGGTAPAILNAANEAAVEAFRAYKLSFLQIGEVVAAALDDCEIHADDCLEAVLAADSLAREKVYTLLRTQRLGSH